MARQPHVPPHRGCGTSRTGPVTAPLAPRFGALEVAEGALWLGAPRARFRSGGIRLGPRALSQWGGLGPRDTPWELIGDHTVVVGEPEPRRWPRAAPVAHGVFNLVSLYLSRPDDFRELNGGVRMDWVDADSGERRWAVGAANWDGALTVTERHAALAVPAAFCRSERFRRVADNGETLVGLVRDLGGAADPDEIDAILTGLF